jgi:hypothetical protein
MFPFGNIDTPDGLPVAISPPEKCCLPSGRRKKRGGRAVHYLGFVDLRRRWPLYTVQGLRKVVARDDFPSPFFTVDGGKTRIWDERDIQIYEATHPEMTDAAKKRRKVIGFAIANFKKTAQAQ